MKWGLCLGMCLGSGFRSKPWTWPCWCGLSIVLAIILFRDDALQESKFTQQALLEENSTVARLEREKEVLAETLKFYTAASALEGVFGSKGSSSEPGPSPPPGAPD
jgi:hypothetical protein